MHTERPKMVLTLFMHAAGYHKDSWRAPDSRAEELGYLDLVADLTKGAEAAKLHAIFFGDMVTTTFTTDGDIKFNAFYEPIATLSALAAITERIGLIGTISTSFTEPYNVARQLATLDNLSGGRAGWNIVTSAGGNEHFGIEQHLDRPTRYRRAEEHVRVCKALWDSWGDDAVIADRESGRWMDLERIHPINHEGEFFKVRGPLNMRRPIQGWPLLVQAGSSESGLGLGAAVADAIYTSQPVKAKSIEYVREYRRRIAEAGRDPMSVKILPGILPIIGETQSEAEEIAETLTSYIDMDHSRGHLAQVLRMAPDALDDLDLDAPIPAELWVADRSEGSRYEGLRIKGVDRGFTLRELIIDVVRAGGHQWLVGTPQSIADVMVDWFDSGACDGFNLNPPYTPDGFDRIYRLLVPELQERGVFQRDYTGRTLREHLGLARPTG